MFVGPSLSLTSIPFSCAFFSLASASRRRPPPPQALNVTTTQDARLRVGVDVLDRSFFAEVRENRLSACVEWRGGKPGWSLLYDL